MADRSKKEMEIQKSEYLENEKTFLDEIKTVFIVFKRLLVRNKILIKSSRHKL